MCICEENEDCRTSADVSKAFFDLRAVEIFDERIAQSNLQLRKSARAGIF